MPSAWKTWGPYSMRFWGDCMHRCPGTSFHSPWLLSVPEQKTSMNLLCYMPAQTGVMFTLLGLSLLGSQVHCETKHTLKRRLWRILVVSSQSTSRLISASSVIHSISVSCRKGALPYTGSSAFARKQSVREEPDFYKCIQWVVCLMIKSVLCWYLQLFDIHDSQFKAWSM